ncbi:MAG: hypothetical protein R2848_00410 [Thermomicrobiales bacterium]
MPLTAYEIEGWAWHVTIDVARRNGAPFARHHVWILNALLTGERDEAVLHLIGGMPDHQHALIDLRPSI